jgi:hypothetical protein
VFVGATQAQAMMSGGGGGGGAAAPAEAAAEQTEFTVKLESYGRAVALVTTLCVCCFTTKTFCPPHVILRRQNNPGRAYGRRHQLMTLVTVR